MPDFAEVLQNMIDHAVEKAMLAHLRDLQRSFLQGDRLLSIPELAEYSGYSESTIKIWIHRDFDPLPAFRPNKNYCVKLPEFLEWLEKSRVGRRKKKEKLIDTEAKK